VIVDEPLGALVSPPGVPTGRTRHPVLVFLIRRVGTGLVTLLIATILIFLATNALPGDVSEVVLGKHASPQLVASLDKQLGLDQSLPARYVDWLGGLLKGDLGQSAAQLANGATSAPVSKLIGAPLVNSAVLAIGTILFLIPLSLLAGTLAAVRAGRPSDYAVSYSSLILGSLPEFVLGTFLILIFFSQLHWLQPIASVPPGTSPLDNVKALILPIMTLLGVAMAFCARQVRAGVIEALRQDYVKMARLSGLPEQRVLRRYALRNAIAPSIQTFAQAVQYLFGGIIVVEALFGYPGVGSLLVQAVSLRDVSEVQAITVVLAAVYIAINILADLLVVLLVPKLRTGL
jgi:peptide/nickel transport system permease protein